MRAAIRFRDNSKWRTFAWSSARSRRFDRGSKQWLTKLLLLFRFQEAERHTGGHPKIALDPLCLKDATLCLFSHLNLVLSSFAPHKSDLGWSTFSTSGTRLKVETKWSDPQSNCLDWRAHQVWWINSVRKCSGNIFEGWWFFFLLLAPLMEDEAKTHPIHWASRHKVKDVENRSQNGSTELD